MNFSGPDLISAASAIGAGLAVIAGIGPGVGQGIACQPCFLDRPLPRQQVFMVWLLR